MLPAPQLILIREGRGTVEWTRERRQVSAGQAFLIVPGVWHRYRPDASTGWTEDWLELRGEMVERWLAEDLLKERVFKPSVDCFERMDQLHQIAGRHQDPGESAGLAMALLAKVLASAVSGTGRERKTRRRDLVAHARRLLGEGWPVAAVAQEVGVSYPTLSRIFKDLSGISPKAYARQIRLARAEAYLAGEGRTIKEIAAELGFHSAGHFSAEFKRAYGCAPLHWRERLRRTETGV